MNHIYLTLIIIIITGIPGISGENDKLYSIRGLWVVRHELTTSDRIDSLLKCARQCNFTDLFVQVRGRGDAYYNSSIEPKADNIKDKEFDPLRYLLNKTVGDSIHIHAWVNVFYVWSKDSLPSNQNHIVRRRSDWLARPKNQPEMIRNYPNSVKNAKTEGLYISPLLPDAQENFLNIVMDILDNYEVHGLHLDYIRFPNNEFDSHPDVVKGFRNRYVLNPENFLNYPELFAEKFSVAGYEVFYNYWKKYLMNGLSAFVERLSNFIHKKYEQVILTAAVKPDITLARWEYNQDWSRWLIEGWLDMAIPMNYSPVAESFTRRIHKYIEKLPPEKYLVGIAMYNQPEEQVIRKIAQVEALNNAGFVLFSYQQLIQAQLIQEYLKKNGSIQKSQR